MNRPKDIGQTLDFSGYVFAFLLILSIYAIHVASLIHYPFFSPSSNVEEAAYTYLSAANFNKYGFWATHFLQDFATSPYVDDHPYVYSHMPPGPDITMALLLKVTGQNYTAATIILASMVPVGFIFYILFIREILNQKNLVGAGFVMMFVTWWQFATHLSRPISSPLLLLVFLPLFMIIRNYKNPSAINIPISVFTIFISSIYLDYAVLSSVIFCWALLYFTQLVPLKRRHLIIVLGTIFFGIFLNLFKNFLHYGPSLFIQELVMLLGNRISGFPTQDMLKDFYIEHGIVHHGARRPHLSILIEVIKANVAFAGRWQLVTALLLLIFQSVSIRFVARRYLIFFRLPPTATSDLRYLIRLLIWSMGTVVAPIVLFPAFAQEVNLFGIANMIWMGVAAISIASLLITRYGHACRQLLASSFDRERLGTKLREFWSGHEPPKALRLAVPFAHIENPIRLASSVTVLLCVFFLLLDGALTAARYRFQDIQNIANTYEKNSNENLEPLRSFDKGLFMTNINTPTLYFFLRQPGFGVCGLQSVGDDGSLDLSDCKISFMRQAQKYAQERPLYFFLFHPGQYFPGFADCLPKQVLIGQDRGPKNCVEQQEQRLEKNYQRIFENDIFSVFDLSDPITVHK